MAQNIILKRSSQSGKVPTTSSLNLGEIALNTYDGRAFLHKSGSTNTIEHIVVTNSITTGSINITQTGSFGEVSVTNDLNVGDSVFVTNDVVIGGDVDAVGAVTASFFVGDGSLLTGISAGATDTEIPTNDWDYNVSDSASLSDGNNISTKYTVDFQAEGYGARPVGYQTFITNTNGSTEIIPGTDGVIFIVNNQEVGRVDASGIVAAAPIGTISSSAQITALGFVSSSTGNINTSSFATTGSNTFTGSQSISGAVWIDGNLNAGNLTAGNTGSNFNTITLVTSDINFTSSLYSTIGIDVDNGGEHSAGISVSTYTQFGQTPTTILYGGGSGSNATGANDSIYFQNGKIDIVKNTTISGSLNVTDSITGSTNFNTIVNKPTLISGSSQLPTLATTGSNTFTGLQTFQQIQEVISLKPSLGLGTNNFDFNSGSIFYVAGLTGSGTWNVQNIVSASNTATSLTFVVQQGTTAYTASAYQLGGTTISIKWLDGTVPTGSANSTDIIGLTAFRSGSSWNVVGSLSKFS